MTLAPWYQYRKIDDFGVYPDPDGAFPKPDINFFDIPDNYPITALLPGVVSGINSPIGIIPPFGAVVTIKLDKPINAIATHYAFLHLSAVHPGIVIGTPVNVGDVVGYAGGNAAAGTEKDPLGFALYPGDFYGYGPDWTQYIQTPNNKADQRLNPIALLNAAKANNLDITSPSNYSYSNTGQTNSNAVGRSLQRATVVFQPDENVAAVLNTIDRFMSPINPFDTQYAQNQGSLNNPLSYASYVLNNIVADLVAIILDGIFIIGGIFVCFKVISSFIDFSAIIGKAENAAGQAAKIAALAA